jgi:cytochrome c oxidase subunit 3
LSSGATVTFAHHALIKKARKGTLYGSIYTILLAIIFTVFQYIEYSVSSFTISDGAFGATFFFGTGFHGLHVIIGSIFLIIAL